MRKEYDLKEDFDPRSGAVEKLNKTWKCLRKVREELKAVREKARELEIKQGVLSELFMKAVDNSMIRKEDIVALSMSSLKDEEDSDNTE